MRRPLCVVCFAFVSGVILLLMLFPPEPFPTAELQGKMITVEGKVCRKEYKNNSFLIYLKNPIIADVDRSIQSLDILQEYTNLNGQSDRNHIPNKEEFIQNRKPEGILCYMQGNHEPKMGSVIRVSGRAEAFTQASNDGQFDMRRYYKIQHMDFKVVKGQITAESREFSGRLEFLYQLRERGGKIYEQYFSQENASIMKAMVFGNKTQLDADIKELYKTAGISHLLVVSGLHISMIGMGLYKLLRGCRIPSAPAAAVCIIIMVQYGGMTGMGTSSFRAVFMFSLHLLAGLCRRTYDLITAMALSAVCLLIGQPMYVFDSGFLLSFGAVTAVGLVYPAMGGGGAGRRGVLHKGLHSLKNSLLVSLSVLLTTLPVLTASFYQFSLLSIFLNLLVIPLMSFLLVPGLLVLPASAVRSEMAAAAAIPCNMIMSFYKQLCERVGALTGYNWIVGKPEAWQIVLYFFGLILLIIFHEKISAGLKYMGIAFMLLILTAQPQRGLSVFMLDVGQGDCFCIRTEMGSTYLVDGGSSSEKEIGKYKIIPFLKSHKITDLEAVLVSHSDEDHINGIRELLEYSGSPGAVKVHKLILPGIGDCYKDEKYRYLERLAKEKNVDLIYFNSGSGFRDGKLLMECLHPSKDFQAENTNSYSMVLSLSYGEFDMLFTGDVERGGEEKLTEILEQGQYGGKAGTYEVLKTAHHGSKHSTQNDFLGRLGASLALISCGRNNQYGHPHEELLLRLEEHKITKALTRDSGQITINTDGKRYRIHCFLNDSYPDRSRIR